MYNGTIKSLISVNASNIPGWKTKKKIVVFESDDWGSIRMPSQNAFNNLLSAGIPVDKNHYTIYDSLESNGDLEGIFETLTKFRDSTGRHPVMTGVNVVANPLFEKIKESGFSEYIYEPYTETLKLYPEHERVSALWKEGIEKRLFIPVFHGREHLNVQRWLRALRAGNKALLTAFENNMTGIPLAGNDGETVPDIQAAFDPDYPEDIAYMKNIIKSGLTMFEDLYGYRANYFVPANGPFNNSLEEDLAKMGVKYINTGKKQLEPLGNGQYKTNIRFIGQQNRYGQTYLTRNCFFEPSSMEQPANTDWVNNCLKEIEIAFSWHKPATICSHRVNYIGFLHPENRDHSLKKLEELIAKMLKKWPDIEFMTSVELGDLILTQNNKNL